MPNRQDPVIQEFDFNHFFATFAFDELKQTAEEQSDPDLRRQLIGVTNALGNTITELGSHLENEKNEVKETARHKLDQLRDRHVAATERIKEYVASFLSVAPLLDELYMSQNSDIETKDKLYVIRETFRNKEKEIMQVLDLQNEEISGQVRSAILKIYQLEFQCVFGPARTTKTTV